MPFVNTICLYAKPAKHNMGLLITYSIAISTIAA